VLPSLFTLHFHIATTISPLTVLDKMAYYSEVFHLRAHHPLRTFGAAVVTVFIKALKKIF